MHRHAKLKVDLLFGLEKHIIEGKFKGIHNNM